ncbi:MAG TPA: type II toxin-antitoxin system RelE/ParE family toxin, partial [bacterium]|nr:type II toxin-antitoxin system RelE/ParE family toxin [bacterium]HPJ73083.1 type II toxin-antitoxin system RelE/ParE family toxin [bacterium]HPQ66810.1 type II toxin-antitoxin system RelE/ParE family toxin [bacterium]
MSALTKRATVYLEPALHKALRLQSIETSRAVSRTSGKNCSAMARCNVIARTALPKDLTGIPKKDILGILGAIESLADDPRPKGTRKISGQERYRLKQDGCRILYEIEDDRRIVCGVRVGHRRDVYR